MTRQRATDLGAEPLEHTTFTFSHTEAIARAVAGGDTEIDLSGLSQSGGRRYDLAPLAALAWWLLNVGDESMTIELPSDPATTWMLARTGLLFAADQTGVRLRQGNEAVSLEDLLLDEAQPRLPNTNWHVFGLPRSPAPIRAIVDLEDPRRRPPPTIPNSGGRRYPWVDGLHAASSLPAAEAVRFNSDLDQVIYETVSNVHRWAGSTRAMCIVSVTRGGGADSLNRVHVVTMDNGRGIGEGMRYKREAQGVDPDWTDEVQAARGNDPVLSAVDDPDGALLYLLVHRAFGSRAIRSAAEGHGLHATGVIARRRGPLHILSAGRSDEGSAVHLEAEKSSDGPNLTINDRVHLPGGVGTLAYLGMWVEATPDHGVAATGVEAEPTLV